MWFYMLYQSEVCNNLQIDDNIDIHHTAGGGGNLLSCDQSFGAFMIYCQNILHVTYYAVEC